VIHWREIGVRDMSYRTRPKEFYNRFRDEPELAKRIAFQLGREMGMEWKERYGVRGGGLEAIAELLNIAMRSVHSDPTARVEGNRVVMVNRSFCVIMRAALTLGVPWEWLDENYAWPWLEGIVSVVRPDVKMTVKSARSRGDSVCIHVFEVEQEVGQQ